MPRILNVLYSSYGTINIHTTSISGIYFILFSHYLYFFWFGGIIGSIGFFLGLTLLLRRKNRKFFGVFEQEIKLSCGQLWEFVSFDQSGPLMARFG